MEMAMFDPCSSDENADISPSCSLTILMVLRELQKCRLLQGSRSRW